MLTWQFRSLNVFLCVRILCPKWLHPWIASQGMPGTKHLFALGSQSASNNLFWRKLCNFMAVLHLLQEQLKIVFGGLCTNFYCARSSEMPFKHSHWEYQDEKGVRYTRSLSLLQVGAKLLLSCSFILAARALMMPSVLVWKPKLGAGDRDTGCRGQIQCMEKFQKKHVQFCFIGNVLHISTLLSNCTVMKTRLLKYTSKIKTVK